MQRFADDFLNFDHEQNGLPRAGNLIHKQLSQA
jgi:hypothetical protein